MTSTELAILTERGGVPYDERTFRHEVLRAQMVEIVQQHCFNHAAQVVDELLDNFDVRRVFTKEKR